MRNMLFKKKYDLQKFINAHDVSYLDAVNEIKNEKKISHWMWYIFPQIDGLGASGTAKHYSLSSIDEAREYMDNPILGRHMEELCGYLLNTESSDALAIFGMPDNLKLRSSMTLFKEACPDNDIFQKVLDKFYEGKSDELTINILYSRNKQKNML